jgi:Glycosyltransferase
LTVDTGLSAERKNFLGEGRVIALPCLFRRFYVPRFSFRQINALVEKSDVIHLMGHWTVLNALVYLFIRKHNKPYAVCPAGALPLFGRSKLFKKIYNVVVGNRIVRNASMCIAVTVDETASFVTYGVEQNKILVIPNGIAETDFLAEDEASFRKKFGLSTRSFILFVGRLNLIKGPDLLLKAFCEIKNKFPEIDLVYVGPDSGMLSELKNIVKSENLEPRVRFLGYLGGDDKSHAYHAAKFLAIPSRQEAMSIVVLEAGVCGTPVLLTDQCGFNQIADVDAGWVVSATTEGLKDGLTEVLSDSNRTKASATNIKKYVTDNYSWDIVVRKYLDIYSKILNTDE